MNLAITRKAHTEDKILELMRKKDQKFLNLIYEEYGNIMLKITMGIVKSRDIAEDVLQDSLVKIWKNAESFDAKKAKLLTWVVQIAKNTALDHVRSKASRNTEVTDSMSDKPVTAEMGTSEQSSDTIGLKELINKTLEKRDQEILDLVYFQGYTQREVAENLAIPLGTVKTRIRYTVNQLRTLMSR